MAWTLSDIRTRWRALTGRGTTGEISDADVNTRINDFYCLRLPLEVDLDELKVDWTQEATVTDDGEYSLDQADIDLNEPFTANGDLLEIIHDSSRFFKEYPKYVDEDFITAPTLAIGTSDTAKVLNSAFKYLISGWTYPKVAAETALSGDTVPQNTYGAYLLTINSSGTISVTEAGANATGYATAARAVDALTNASASSAIIGFVTVISTDLGGFVPGTTALDDSTVTDTYTDGNPSLRNIPDKICIAGGKLFVQPKCNDTFLIRAHLTLSRPTALTDAVSPIDDAWGKLIAIGAAIDFLSEKGETKRVGELTGQSNIVGTYEYLKMMVDRKKIKQQQKRECLRSF